MAEHVTFLKDSEWNPSGFRTEHVPDSALSQPASQPSSNSPPVSVPTDGTKREPTTTERINSTDPWIGLAAVISRLRPDWKPGAIYAAIVRAEHAPRDLVRIAVAMALDPDTHSPARITTADPRPTTPAFPRALRCPHGVLADPDGLGAGCEGCGTRAVPMPPGLRVLPRAEGDAP